MLKYDPDFIKEGVSPWHEVSTDEITGQELTTKIEEEIYAVDPKDEAVLFILKQNS